jgi:hypothetical protein
LRSIHIPCNQSLKPLATAKTVGTAIHSTQNNSKQLKTTQNNSKQLKTTQNNSKQLKTTQNDAMQ